MTVKELFELKLEEHSEGIWIHFVDEIGEHYLDEEYETSFSDVLDREVLRYFLDSCDYDILEIKLK